MKDNRIVTYLSEGVAAWVRKQAESMGFNESSYIRFLIMKEKRNTKGK